MPTLGEIKTMGDNIVRSHSGQVYFNFGEVAKIIGCGINTVPALFSDAGMLVKKVGPSKRVSAYDVAELMYSKRIASFE